MRLGLCSGALPDATLHELLEAATRRGISALELRAGDGHRIDPARPFEAAAEVDCAYVPGVEIVAFRTSELVKPQRLARLGELLSVPILIDGPTELDIRLQRGCCVHDHGTSAALVVRGPGALEEARVARDRGLDVAWDAGLEGGSPGRTLAALLEEVRPQLRHIRLHGGGPEAALQEGQGVGEMIGKLAIAGYDGTVILTPTSARYRAAWQGWLERRGGWGCGAKAGPAGGAHRRGGATPQGKER